MKFNLCYKFVLLCATLSLANAGFIGEPVSYASPAISYAAPAITSQSSNILRSPGNLASISAYSKTIDTPFSSVSKSDVRVNNPGIYSTLSYAAPAVSAVPASPLVAKAALAAPAYGYAAPAYGYAAPAVAAPVIAKTYATPYVAKAYAAPFPVLAKAPVYAPAAPIVKSYVPAVAAPGPVVAHTTFTGLGTHYAF